MAVAKAKDFILEAPVGIVEPIVEEYLDGPKWNLKNTDFNGLARMYTARRRSFLQRDHELTVILRSGAPQSPGQTQVSVAHERTTKSQKVDLMGSNRKAIEEFQEEIVAKVREAVSRGEASAAQWRPSV